MDVLIVSKTQMYKRICVGGITADSQFVRLLDEYGQYPNLDTAYQIRQVWSIHYISPNNPRSLPHSEDVCVLSKSLKYTLNTNKTMKAVLNKKNINIYQGSISNLFEQKLKFTQFGSGYICNRNIPQNSVCFWLTDRELIQKKIGDKIKYSHNDKGGSCHIPYVGLAAPVSNIPPGTLVRMSLANWWSPNITEQKKCYLQLSGWYDI